MALVEQVRADPGAPPVPAKLEALLTIAAAVRESGRAVTTEQVAGARAAGATDAEIHDTVLIAAVFCMFNRYVDGHGSRTCAGLERLPDDQGHLQVLTEPRRSSAIRPVRRRRAVGGMSARGARSSWL